MVGIFVKKDGSEVIVVGLHQDGSPMDQDNIIFDEQDLDLFDRIDIDVDKGQAGRVNITSMDILYSLDRINP